jgi:hypothetical protein
MPFNTIYLLLIIAFCSDPDWGFFGHRQLNKYAVFTLPEDMLPLYKSNIKYIEEHAVDPDKRRYATKYEAVRHYIDIDHWGTYPFDNVPRDFGLAITKFSDWYLVDNRKDTIPISVNLYRDSLSIQIENEIVFMTSQKLFNWFFNKNLMSKYYEDEIKTTASALDIFFNNNIFSESYSDLIVVDRFSDYGVLPYHLVKAQRDLTQAFIDEDFQKVLRISADFGHYIGDAHVPLHTTENYNGQFSDQLGIHAFWESRIPELFALETYDLFAGKAEYINDKVNYYWEIVLESHSYLDEVLKQEKLLSETYPSDQQYCYDERLNNTVRIQCPEFAKAYQDAMKGMVEARWVSTIKSIGNAWYTAWVDAGQPPLSKDRINVIYPEIIPDKNIVTRDHSIR